MIPRIVGALAALALLAAAPARAEEPALTLTAPKVAAYSAAVKLTGSVTPAIPGARVRIYRSETYVTTVYAGAAGRFAARVRARAPGSFHARMAEWRSPAVTIAIRPRVTVRAPDVVLAGVAARVSATAEPAGAVVTLRVTTGGRALVRRGRGTVSLAFTPSAGRIRVDAAVAAGSGFAAARARAAAVLATPPNVPYGGSGASVRLLEQELADRRFALQRVDGLYGRDTAEAVIALQKLSGLPRTGRVDARTWRALLAFRAPRIRAPDVQARHLEIDKARQVLVEVERGEVLRIIHASTGATGNTPVGRWRVYRRVAGYSWVLYYPLYFLRGFAVHGYPSVPVYPASHGCVRIPMWIAPSLFSHYGTGTTVVVHA